MASSPVWKVRINPNHYRSVPAYGDDISEDCSSRRSSGSSDDSSLSFPLTNCKPQKRKTLGAQGLKNKYRDVWFKGVKVGAVKNVCSSLIVPSKADTCCDKRIIINISGTRFETFESTLARLPTSLLGSSIKKAPYYDPNLNEYYFDRNQHVFDSILFYYQSGGPVGGVLVKPDGIPEGTFLEEVKFFELGEDAERKIGAVIGADDETGRKLGRSFGAVSANISYCETCSSKIRMVFDTSQTRKASPLLRAIDLWMIFITIFFIILLCGKTLPSLREVFALDQCCEQYENNASVGFFWSFSEKFCISWFTLEYALRTLSATKKSLYLVSANGIFDLLSFFPYIMTIIIQVVVPGTATIPFQRILMFLMFFSVFKLTRYSLGLQVLMKTIQTSLQELMLLLVCVGISLVLFSSVIYYFESSEDSTDFNSIPATFWFTIVTMTTVGYGDLAPVTVAGKVFSALCAVFGVCCVLAIPSTIIVTNFNFFYLKYKAKPKKPKRPNSRTTALQKWVSRFRSVAL